MNPVTALVNAAGVGIIFWTGWYFWFWKPKGLVVKGGSAIQEVDITVKGGYQPSLITIEAGKPLRLKVTRREPSTCGEEMVLLDFGKRIHLPEGETVMVDLLPEKPGEFDFHCPMNMYRGKLIVQPQPQTEIR